MKEVLKRNFETMKNDRQQPLTNRTELENVAASASPKYSFYQPNKIDHEDLKVELKSSRLQFEVQLLEMQVSLPGHHKDTDEMHYNLRKMLVNDHSTIIYCIDEMGLLCAYEAVKICIANAKAMEECDLFKDCGSKCLCFLEESLSLIENSLPNGHENIFNAGCDFEKMVAAGYISPKLQQLFKLFRSFGGATKVSCIIFVDRIITAKILDIVTKRVVDLSHFQVSYLTGNATAVDAMSAKMQNETLESFLSGKVDLLFASDCVEEGINMPKYSTVIHFDIPNKVSSNVQSWGWTRQSGSRFIILLERGNEKQREHICDILRSAHLMYVNAKKRDPDTSVVKQCKFDEKESSLTAESSVTIIHRYCSKLSADKSYSPKPSFQFLLLEDSYQCVLSLPPNAVFQQITGPLCKSASDAKQLVCLEACKKLHQMGALAGHLPTNNEDPLENKSSEIIKEPPSGAAVLKSINTGKGGPRTSLYELCRKMQWPMPVLTSSEQKSKTLIEIGEGVDKRTAFNSFESRISLTIPSFCVIELTGERCADKKSSFDSAALRMLYELQRLGKLIIE